MGAGPIGEEEQFIVGGTVDADTATLNATVMVGNGCSGTLITPLLVLSARHCFPDDGAETTVWVGPNAATYGGSGTVTIFPTDQPWHGNDIVLIRLAPTAARFQGVAEPRSVRPATAPPALSEGQAGTFSETVEIAGYSRTPRERAQILTRASRSANELGAEWRYGSYYDDSVGGAAIEGGDSGGSMVRVLPDGTRQLIGVNTSSTCANVSPACTSTTGEHDSTACDVTSPLIRDWIASHAKVIRSTAWRTAHGYPRPGGQTDVWYGDVDYTGAIDTVHDPDGDHWYNIVPAGLPGAGTSHDNCPSAFNPLQEDLDDDGIGDACACPADTANGGADVDHDGVCGVTTDGSEPDNCPRTYNPQQENCNYRSEHELGRVKLGDVCDPVPCPAFTQAPREILAEACPGAGSRLVATTCVGLVERDGLTMRSVGAYPREFVGSAVLEKTPPGGYPVTAPTTAHFCNDNADAQVQCDSGSNLLDSVLTVEAFSGAVNPALPWHKASLRAHGGFPAVARGQAFTAAYPGQRELRWDYAADASYWQSQGTLYDGDRVDCELQAGVCLNGHFALKAVTTVGDQVANVDYQGENLWIGAHGPDLATHVEPMSPIGFEPTRVINAQKGLLERDAWMRTKLVPIEPDPPLWFEQLGIRKPYDWDQLTFVERIGDQWYFVTPDGDVHHAGHFLSSGVRSALGSAVGWLAPQEITADEGQDAGLIVQAHANNVFSFTAVRRNGVMFSLPSEIGQSNSFKNSTGLPSGYPLFVRSAGALIVVTANAIHVKPGVGSFVAHSISGTVTPRTIVSAAYAQGRLWLADYGSGQLRLTSFASTTSFPTGTTWSGSVVAQIPAASFKRDLLLGTAGDGSLLVAANTRSSSSWQLSRIRVLSNGTLSTTSLRSGSGLATSEPFANKAGVVRVVVGGAIAGRGVAVSDAIESVEPAAETSIDASELFP